MKVIKWYLTSNRHGVKARFILPLFFRVLRVFRGSPPLDWLIEGVIDIACEENTFPIPCKTPP